MKKGNVCSVYQRYSAICMALALLWLTVSTPFVLRAQQEGTAQEWSTDMDDTIPAGEEESNPLGNTQEEKASSVSLSEEFLHEHHHTDHLIDDERRSHPSHHTDTYIAYHGELLVPPPNAA